MCIVVKTLRPYPIPPVARIHGETMFGWPAFWLPRLCVGRVSVLASWRAVMARMIWSTRRPLTYFNLFSGRVHKTSLIISLSPIFLHEGDCHILWSFPPLCFPCHSTFDRMLLDRMLLFTHSVFPLPTRVDLLWFFFPHLFPTRQRVIPHFLHTGKAALDILPSQGFVRTENICKMKGRGTTLECKQSSIYWWKMFHASWPQKWQTIPISSNNHCIKILRRFSPGKIGFTDSSIGSLVLFPTRNFGHPVVYTQPKHANGALLCLLVYVF